MINIEELNKELNQSTLQRLQQTAQNYLDKFIGKPDIIQQRPNPDFGYVPYTPITDAISGQTSYVKPIEPAPIEKFVYKRLFVNKSLTGVMYPVGNEIKSAILAAHKMAEILYDAYKRTPLRLLCSGSSGAILSAIIADSHLLDVIEIIHVKKSGEEHHVNSHDIRQLTCNYSGRVLNIIVDDFICSGRTVERIYDTFTHCNISENVDGIIVNGYFNKNCGKFQHMKIDDIFAEAIN